MKIDKVQKDNQMTLSLDGELDSVNSNVYEILKMASLIDVLNPEKI